MSPRNGQEKRQERRKAQAIKQRLRINVVTAQLEAVAGLQRQIPNRIQGGLCRWKDLDIVFNQPLAAQDIVVVWHYPPTDNAAMMGKKMSLGYVIYKIKNVWRKWLGQKPIFINHPRQRKIHIQTEPLVFDFIKKLYTPTFLSQFGTVVSYQPRPHWYRDGNWHNDHGGLEWWYGIAHNISHRGQRQVKLGWRELIASPRKNKTLSVITSTQAITDQQRRRLAFVDMLSADKDLAGQVDLFGKRRQFIANKADGLAPYRYHVALENSLADYYWTEKLADPILAECCVFYAGAPNIHRYFDKGSIIAIDIKKPAQALAIIKKTIDADGYKKARSAIKENKRRLMMEENFFNLIWRVVHQYHLAE